MYTLGTINKNGKTINKRTNPLIREITINGRKIKYWFWKVTVLNDFDELWEGADREIVKDSVEYGYLTALLRQGQRTWGDDLTVWDGLQKDGKITMYWQNNNIKGDERIGYKELKDLYNGEWYIVDENGIPIIEREREKAKALQEKGYKPKVVQQELYQTRDVQINRPTPPPTQIVQGNVHIVTQQPNQVLTRGKQFVINTQPNPNQNNNNPRPVVKINRNF